MVRHDRFCIERFTLGLYTEIAEHTTAQITADVGTLKVAGLRERMTVRRDERGIPCIEATNDHDLYFAQGDVTPRVFPFSKAALERAAGKVQTLVP